MTEQEWLECSRPKEPLKYLGSGITERKFRLFGAACCRRIWTLLDNDATRRVVEIAEQVADGKAPADLLGAVWSEAYRDLVSDEDADAAYHLGWGGLISNKRIFGHNPNIGLWFYAYGLAVSAADALARSKSGMSCLEDMSFESGNERASWLVDLCKEVYREENGHQVRIIRCIFGNPFHPVSLDRTTLTHTVVSLAHAVYDEVAFDRLPILADALEDAGCHDAAILEHCRGPGPHVRGCWVLDLLLERA